MAVELTTPAPEQTRARYPDESGHVERDGVRLYWEVYGTGSPTVFLLPTWSIIHSRHWKMQIAYLARHCRVLVMDGRGNGRSDRPLDPEAYRPWEFSGDALAVMDATGTARAVLVSTSMGTYWNLLMSAGAPERVIGSLFIGPPYAVSDHFPDWTLAPFNERLESYEGANRYNRHFIRDHYAEFATWWAELCLPERHSTRPLEFTLDMALDTTPEVILATLDAGGVAELGCVAEAMRPGGALLRQLAEQVRCPTVVVQGALELIAPTPWAAALAEDTGGELFMIDDAGHSPGSRKPVAFNLKLRSLVESISSGA